MIEQLIEFLQNYQKNRNYDTNKLYVGKMGKINTIKDIGFTDTTFDLDRIVILSELSDKEQKKFLKQKYGTYFGDVNWTDTPGFIFWNHGIKCYKVISSNKILPETDIYEVTNHLTETGTYEVISKSKPLKNCVKKNVSLKSTLNLDEICQLEDMLNEELTIQM